MKNSILGLAVVGLAVFAAACSDNDSGNNRTPEKTYSVGDLYDVKGVKGIVYKITDAAGKHGMILSLDEAEMQWAVDGAATVKTGATEIDDGAKNMAAVMAIDGWQTNYPAFAWCAAMNTGGVNGWFLPAFSQLADLFEAYASAPEGFNDSLTEDVGGTAILTDTGTAPYWSSSENLVAGKESEAAFFDFSSESIGFKDKPDVARVRAVHAF